MTSALNIFFATDATGWMTSPTATFAHALMVGDRRGVRPDGDANAHALAARCALR